MDHIDEYYRQVHM